MYSLPHIYIHTFHISISVTKTAGCETSHKYTTIQIYSVKYYEHFTKTVL